MGGFSDRLSDSILIAKLNGAYLRTNSNKNNGLYKTNEKKKIAKYKRTCGCQFGP